MPNFSLGSQVEVFEALNKLDNSGESGRILQEIQRVLPRFTLRVGDLVALGTSMVRQRGSTLVQVPAPNPNSQDVTVSAEGRTGLRSCLRQYVHEYLDDVELPPHRNLSTYPRPPGVQTILLLGQLDEFYDSFPEWESKPEPFAVRREEKYLDAVHDELTVYLRKLSSEGKVKYTDLVASHLRFGVFRDQTPLQPGTRPETQRSHLGDEVRKQCDHLLEKGLKVMNQDRAPGVGELTAIELMDCWASMMTRACCWGAAHVFVEGETVPIAYYGSQLPVYIG